MFSTTLKRSAATLGVIVGLLAAAGSASAQAMPAMVGMKAPGPCANVPAQLSIGGAEAAGFVNGCAPGYVPVRENGSQRVDQALPLFWQGIVVIPAVQDADMAI
jgi:hypothetical protein